MAREGRERRRRSEVTTTITTTTTPSPPLPPHVRAINVSCFSVRPQARLAELDTPRRLENLQKLEELKRHLMDLEKQVGRALAVAFSYVIFVKVRPE